MRTTYIAKEADVTKKWYVVDAKMCIRDSIWRAK